MVGTLLPIKVAFLLLANLLVLSMLFIAVNSPTLPGRGKGFNAPLPFNINLSIDFTYLCPAFLAYQTGKRPQTCCFKI